MMLSDRLKKRRLIRHLRSGLFGNWPDCPPILDGDELLDALKGTLFLARINYRLAVLDFCREVRQSIRHGWMRCKLFWRGE